MKPTTFPAKNKTYHKPKEMTDEECSPLDVFDNGKIKISCWEMEPAELLYLLFYRKVWLTVHCNIQPPVSLQVQNPFIPEGEYLPDMDEFVKTFLKRKVKQFCEREYVKADLASGIMIDDADKMETLVMNFIISAFYLEVGDSKEKG